MMESICEESSVQRATCVLLNSNSRSRLKNYPIKRDKERGNDKMEGGYLARLEDRLKETVVQVEK